jgi:6-pyruvoyl-tetrahydropterin synthase
MEASALSELLLARTLSFEASHAYRLPGQSLDAAKAMFGPYALEHSHCYRLTLWLRGTAEPPAMMACDLPRLDAAMEEAVAPLRGMSIQQAVPWFADRLPTTEALVLYFQQRLTARLPASAIAKIRLAESEDLVAEWLP